MGNPLFILIVTVSAVWIYLDATKNKIGKTDQGGMFNISAGAWGVCALLLWIVALPAYLIKRKSLKETAASAPVNVSMRGFKAFMLGAVGVLWFLSVCYAQYLESFPSQV